MVVGGWGGHSVQQSISHHSKGNMQRRSPSWRGRGREVARVRGESPPSQSEQGMYENSCINLSSSPGPPLQQGPEENDAKEKLNLMSKIRQTQLLLSARWPGAQARRAAGKRAVLRPGSFPGLCSGRETEEAGLRHWVCTYIHGSTPLPARGWGAGQNPVQTLLQGGKT